MFQKSVQKFADRPAFHEHGFGDDLPEARRRSRAFAAYLQNNLKFQKGDASRL